MPKNGLNSKEFHCLSSCVHKQTQIVFRFRDMLTYRIFIRTECSNTANTDSEKKSAGKSKITRTQIKTKKRNERRKLSTSSLPKNNDRFVKNLSKASMTDNQIKLLSKKRLKFIPTAKVTKNKIRRQLFRDYKDFARRMRLKYIFHGQNKSVHPFYVKSNWEPPVQPSVTLQMYLEEVKVKIAEIKITRQKPNLSRKERKALHVLQQSKDLNFKKADKGNTLIFMDKNYKIQEGQVQINDLDNYTPLDKPIVKETHTKVSRLISKLHRDNYIDDMTRKWLSQTPNPPRIPEFYTLTKIHKPTLVGRPIISGCSGPTERISAFVDTLLHPISISQTSYLKDTTDFINFIEKTKVNKQTFLVSMDVTSLYTNIPQEEGIATVCRAYENFYRNNPPIPTQYLKEMLSLILKENSFQFNGKNYLQIHGTAMGTKNGRCFCKYFYGQY